MPIDLSDIPTAVGNYLDTEVTTTVSGVSSGGSVEHDEVGTFGVTITNAGAPDGVRLIKCVYHVSVSPPTVAKLQADTSLLMVKRATINPSDPPLKNNELVSDMYLFPNDALAQSALDVGEVAVINGLQVKGIGPGVAKITCHLHAEVDQNSLYPTGEHSSSGTASVTVT
jgi:hypothetical protein